MIYILEDKSQKLMGNTSLYVMFPFCQELIDITKSAEFYYYHKDTHLWEVSINSLAQLIESYIFIDDITLIVQDEDDKDEIVPQLTYKTKPFDYQLEDIKYGLNHDKFYLLNDPGLGKTLVATYIAEELQHKGEIEHCLIVCGIASLRTNWMRELKQHSNLSAMMVGAHITRTGRLTWDTIPKRVNQLMNPIEEFFIIINVESLRNDEIIKALKKGPNKIDMIVVDEWHKCSGTNAKQSQNLLELSAKHQMAMTGTLVVNNPINCYTSLVWLGFEAKRTLTKFKQMYCVFSEYTKGRIIGYKNLDILQNEILSHGIRRKKSDTLELPPKYIIDEYLSMSQAQSDFYYNIADSIKKNSNTKQLAIKDCDKIELDTTNLLSVITRLRQATTCPSYLTSLDIDSCKIDRAKSLAEEIINSGEKVVIFSSFKEPLSVLYKDLEKYNPLLCTGDMSDGDFAKSIEMFQNDDEHKIFLGTLSKCGTGITLTRASYMIMLDEPWTYSLYNQGTDRIYRIGTRVPVTIYNLICENTIDAKIAEIISNKKALSEYIIDDVNDTETLNILQNFVFDLEC